MKDRHWIIIAFGISIAIRAFLVILVYPDTTILTAKDQAMYLDLADKIASGLNMGKEFGSERVPLYPLFLAAVQLVTDNLFIILMVQHLIGLSILAIVFDIGALYSRRIALIAVFLAGANLNFALQSNTILTEAIFYPIFGMFILEVTKYLKNGQIRNAGMAGLYLGLSTLVRSVTMYFPVFVVLFLFVLRGSIRERVNRSLVFAIVFTAVILPWLFRNQFVFGHFALTSQGSPHLIGWIIPSVMQYEEGMDLNAATKASVKAWSQKIAKMPQDIRQNQFALDEKAKRHATQYLLQASPLSIAKAWFWGAMKNVVSPPFIELSHMLKMDYSHFYESRGKSFPEQAFNFVFKNKNRTYSLLLISGILLTLLFRTVQVAGAWLFLKRDPIVMSFFVLVIGYILMISGPVGYAKYRLPFEPILVILTAIAVDKFIVLISNVRRRNLV